MLGSLAVHGLDEWRAGRRLRVQAAVREPARYLDEGVPDLPLSLARRGTVLVGRSRARRSSTSSSWNWVEEWRRRPPAPPAIDRASVGSWDSTTAAIVTAILIGDRAGLDDRIERDLQEAGTYHVIAISGGNIAILAGACSWLAAPARALARRACATILVLLAYAELAGGGSSVARATTMAVVYLGATLIDQRTSPASALAVAASLMLAASPLALVDPAFLLTFGATIAIVVAVPAITAASRSGALRPAVALLAASAAAEVALLPLGPLFFSRVTVAGLLFNFAAVPLMSVVQIGAMAAVAVTAVAPSLAHAAGWVPHEAARALVSSAGLVHVMPWLTWRVPAPPLWVVAIYYSGLVALVSVRVWVRWTIPWHRCARSAVALVTAASAAFILGGPLPSWPSHARLRIVVLDVGQGDADDRQFPSGRTLLVDAGGLGGTARFDIGERVVAPALWQFGVRRLDVLALTHGDADHVGGARRARDVPPRELWEGVPSRATRPSRIWPSAPTRLDVAWRTVQAGDLLRDGRVTVRAWHPPVADWERQRVRNDDSLVLEIRYGDVSIVLPGDIGATVRGRPGEGDAARTGADAEGCTPRQRDLELDALSCGSPPADRRDQLRPRQPLRTPFARGARPLSCDGRRHLPHRRAGSNHDRDRRPTIAVIHSCARRPPGRRTHRSRSRQLSDDGSPRPSTAASGCLAHPASDGRHRCQLRGLLHGHENRKTENGQPGIDTVQPE